MSIEEKTNMSVEEIKEMFSDVTYIVVEEELRQIGSNETQPPTFAGDKNKNVPPPFNAYETSEGLSVIIDTKEKQSRRIIELVSKEYPGLLPKHNMILDNNVDNYYQLPHRIADAILLGTDFRKYIEENILTSSGINYNKLALFDPFSILFGFWDSRVTHLKQEGLVQSKVSASRVKIITENTIYTPYNEFGKYAKEDGVKYADIGLSSVPNKKVNSRVHVDGSIKRSVKLKVKKLFKIVKENIAENESDLIGSYLFLLGLASITAPLIQNDGDLRAACNLKVAGRKIIMESYDDDKNAVTKEIKLNHKQIVEMTKEIAEKIEFNNIEIKQTTENIRKIAKETAEQKKENKKSKKKGKEEEASSRKE